MQQPFFSIIVPVYKVEKYLTRFLESIAWQTFSDYEVLLVDDGSPDSCGAMCDEFCVSHSAFRAIHKPNGGVSSARNRGIEEANGEWLLFFDSDDVIALDALQKIHVAYETHPYTDVVIYAIEEVMNNGKHIDHLLPVDAPSFYDFERIRKEILPWFCRSASFLNSPCSKAFKRSIIEDNNLRFQKRVRGEDWLFCLQYFRCVNHVVTIPDVLYSYMRNEDSAMSKYVPEQFQLWTENWQTKCNLIKDFGLEVDIDLMKREMYEKVYYFLKEVMVKEPEVSRKDKLHTILHNDTLRSFMRAYPINLHDLRAYLFINLWKIMY